ncbi:fumarylacetoacetate hydrolase family protein [Actinomyces vulturis]|uniref:fumarylacetoacetate hydrolase family protein n=1 Tax=Actinomyces vulturis TaxID=1857645 RepID=UPI00082CBEF0|nr:fumarylacetoacetate hydrolase family protein [Actinomyces vulturis]
MKIARFAMDSSPKYGIVQGLDEHGTPTESAHLVVLKADPLVGGSEATGEVVRLDEVRLLSPVIPRSKVIGIGNNYANHVMEMGDSGEQVKAEPPTVFLKPNTAVIGPDMPIVLPWWSNEVHYEGELAVVIKTLCKDVTPEQAERVILGYTCANDVSARDVQRSEPQWIRAKAFDTSCPIGPWIEIPEPSGFDPMNAQITTSVNGQVAQCANTRDMIRDVYELVSYVSSIFTLLPGDLVLTGTPAGVGALHAGDRVSVRIDGLGEFSNPVVSE